MSTVSFGDAMKAQGYELGPRCYVSMGVATIAGMALFIIGCVGASGAFPGSTIGWLTVALAGGGFVFNLALGNFKQRKFELIMPGLVAAVLVTVGALGGAGILSATQVGWGVVGTSLAALPLSCVANCLKKKRIQQLNNT